MVGKKKYVEEFITFGFDHMVNDYPLANHYMIINREEAEQFVKRNENGNYEFAFSYPLTMLSSMKERFNMKEIKPEIYMALKRLEESDLDLRKGPLNPLI